MPAKRQPTIQDLLRHTSGFTYGARGTTGSTSVAAGLAVASTLYTGPEFLDTLGKLPLLYQPGTSGTTAYRPMCSASSSKPSPASRWAPSWRSVLEAAWHGRHELRHPRGQRARYALAFPNDPLTNKPQSVLHASGKPIKFECGGACAVSTTMDYLRFAQMLVNSGTLEGNTSSRARPSR